MRIRALFLFFFLLSISGCGYTTRSLIPQSYQTIYVRPFVNKIIISEESAAARRYQTYYPLLETIITQEVLNQFMLDGSLHIARDEKADLILDGELVSYRRDALRYTGRETRDIEEYRVSFAVNLKLYDRSRQAMLWELKGLTGDTTYLTGEEFESSAIGDAVSDLARRIVDRVVEEWF